jgi:hypothetical protein
MQLIRHEKAWTLSDVAHVSELSLNTLQKALKSDLTQATRLKIESAMDFSFGLNSTQLLQDELEYYFSLFIYGEYEAAYEKTTDLLERHIEYQNSSLYLDYWIHLYACAMHTKDERIDAVAIQKKVAALTPFNDRFLQELYDVESITYAYLMSQTSVMLALPKAHYETRQDGRLKALNLYMVGAYYSQRYTRINEGVKLLKNALTLFEEQANYVRSNQTRVVLQEAYLWAKDFEAYRTLYRQSMQYIQLTKNRRLELIMNETVIQFHLTQGEFQDALNIALPNIDRHYQNVFVVLFCAFMTKQEPLYQTHVARMEKAVLAIMHPFYNEAFNWFKLYAFKPIQESKESFTALRKLWQLALNEEYYYLIAISARWLIRLYTQARRYKEAQAIAAQWQRVEAAIV